MANQTFEELRKKIDSNDPFMTSGHQILKPRSDDKKKIPDWARDDKKVREIILRSFPKLGTNDRHRRGAARWVRVIHLYFRMHMTRGQVAVEMNISPVQVKSLIQAVRSVASGQRANRTGKLGKPRGRPKINRAPI